jgi:hypothetical protein
MRSDSWRVIARDCPRSWRGLGASASKPPVRYRLAYSSRVSTVMARRLESGMS